MKFMHIADLHIGKVVNNFPLLYDQKHILWQILEYISTEKPDGLLIAGDVYDKAVPVASAVSLLDDFLTELSAAKIPVMLISGNHDSPERLSFAGRIMEKNQLYMAGVFEGEIQKVVLEDEHGFVDVHLLPFIRPSVIRRIFPEEKIEGYETAMKAVLQHNPVDTSRRNVLVAHQFVVASGEDPLRSDSEVEPVGGLNSINSSLFDGFDYVALGHLHGPQRMGRDTVRYAGSPLKYSFSECRQKKSVTMVELKDKGDVQITTLPLTPLREMRKIRGPIDELLKPEVANVANPEDYLHITLTNEGEVLEAMSKLRHVYPHVMELVFDNARSRASSEFKDEAVLENKTPLELFEDFFTEQNGAAPDKEQQDIVAAFLKEWEGSL